MTIKKKGEGNEEGKEEEKEGKGKRKDHKRIEGNKKNGGRGKSELKNVKKGNV